MASIAFTLQIAVTPGPLDTTVVDFLAVKWPDHAASLNRSNKDVLVLSTKQILRYQIWFPPYFPSFETRYCGKLFGYQW